MRPIALLLLATFLACGSGNGGADASDAPADPDVPAIDTADGGEDGLEDLPPAPQDVWNTRYRIVLLGDSADVFLRQDETASLRVKIYDRDAGPAPAAVPDFPVTFAIVAIRDLSGADAEGDATLEQATVQTGANGVAVARIVTGRDCVRIYDVQVTAGDAEPLVYHVQVNCNDCGCVRVTAAYDGTLPDAAFESFEVRAYPELTSCIDLQTGEADPEPTGTTTLSGLDGAASFDCLAATDYSIAVVVSARGASGCPVAWGCQELQLKTGTCRDASLDLYDLFQDATGAFDWTDRLQMPALDEACPGGDTSGTTCFGSTTDLGRAMCCVLGETRRVLGTTRATLAAVVGDAARDLLPDLCSGTDCAQHPVKDAFVAAGVAYGADHGPAWAAALPAALAPVIPSLESLVLSWDATSTQTASGSVSITPAFRSVRLESSQVTLDAATLAAAATPVQVATAPFDASVTPGGKLSFPARTIPLDLGRLYLHLLQDRGIASVSGGAVRTPAEVARAWFDCDWMVPEVLSLLVYAGLDVTELQVREVCETGYDRFLEGLTRHLATVTQASTIVVHGEATLRDDDCDRRAEAFRDGALDGTVQSGGGQGAVVSGTFEAAAEPAP